ncbi:MAG TPA: hypothetical protein VEC11_07815 [Allosphingosinicella sp.]|nr:hypothetical protein [Allosphingosinicella sp.]
MTKVVLVTVAPRNPATGATTTIRLAGGGDRKPYLYGGNSYRAGVAALPRLRAEIGFDEKGWTGDIVPQTGAISWAPYSKAGLTELAAYYWPNAAITIQTGEEETGIFTTLLTGKVADATVQGHRLVITVADLSDDLTKPLVTARFAGTGGIEGGAEAKNRIKRRTWGRAFNIEGRVLDKANNIYEFGDPSFPWQSFEMLRDKGRDAAPAPTVVAWQGSIAATLAALVAAAPAAGSGAVAPSIACAKWWTQPAGPLTADVKGEIGAGYVETAASIAARILTAVGGPAVTNTATADGWRNGVAGIHVDEDETIAQAIDRLLLGVSLVWKLDPAGTVTIREFTFTGPVEALRSEDVERLRSIKPIKTRRVGYQRAYRVHSDGEIASVLLQLDADAAAALNAAVSALAAAADDNVFTKQEKATFLLPTVAELDARYTNVVARAAALGVSTATAVSARSVLRAYLAALTPAYDDVAQDTTLSTNLIAAFPGGWPADCTISTSGIYTRLNDTSSGAFQHAWNSYNVTAGQTVTWLVPIKKDAVAGATRKPLFRVFDQTDGTLMWTDCYVDTQAGSVSVGGSTVPAVAVVLSLNDAEWALLLTLVVPASVTVAKLFIYPAAQTGGSTVPNATGAIDVRDPVFVVGDVDKAGRDVFRYRLAYYSGSLDALAKAISEADTLWANQNGANIPGSNASGGDNLIKDPLLLDSGLEDWFFEAGTTRVAGGAGDPVYFARTAALPSNGLGQDIIPGMTYPTPQLIPWNPDEPLYLSCRFRFNGAGGGRQLFFYVICWNAGFGSEGASVYNAMEAVGTGWTLNKAPKFTVPGNTAYVTVIFAPLNVNGMTLQADVGDFRIGKTELGADVTLTLTPAADQAFSATYTGSVTDTLPRLIVNQLKAGNVDVSSLASWTYTPNGCAVSTSGLSGGQVNITAVSTVNATLKVEAAYLGTTRSKTITITRKDGPIPSDGGGSGATSFWVDLAGDVNEGAYDSTPIVLTPSGLRMRSNASGQIRLVATAEYNVGVGFNKSGTMAMKWQRSPDNSTWTDAGVSATGSGAFSGDGNLDTSVTGYANTNALATGMSASTDYYLRLIAIISSGNGTHLYVTGSASGAQS